MITKESILIVNDFLSKEEIDLLIVECTNSITEWSLRDSIVKVSIASSNQHQLMKAIKNRVDMFFDECYHIQIMRHLNKTNKDTTWVEHSDDEAGKIFSHGAIIYLNNNFVGGELYYPNIDYLYSPKAGDLVIHPSSKKYSHVVKPVLSGDRYTLTTFIKDMSL